MNTQTTMTTHGKTGTGLMLFFVVSALEITAGLGIMESVLFLTESKNLSNILAICAAAISCLPLLPIAMKNLNPRQITYNYLTWLLLAVGESTPLFLWLTAKSVPNNIALITLSCLWGARAIFMMVMSFRGREIFN